MDHPAAWAEMPSHPACCRDWEGLLTNCYGLIPSMICLDRKSTRLNSSHDQISYAVFCLKKKKKRLYSSHDQISYAVVCLKTKKTVLIIVGAAVSRVSLIWCRDDFDYVTSAKGRDSLVCS